MNKLWKCLGTGAFWTSWPLIYFFLRLGCRTRILAVSGNQLLVVKNWLGPNEWSLPGGGLHFGEDPKIGALRELREETGLKLNPADIKFLREGESRVHGLKYKYRCFLAEQKHTSLLKAGKPETLEARWINWQEFLADRPASDAAVMVRKHFQS